MSITPNAMPAKQAQSPDPLHQQILGYLVENRMTTRTEVREKRVDGKFKHVRVEVPVPLLAGNVSDESCDRAARRWLR